MDFGGAQVAAPRNNSFADAAGSPRRTPRHSRNSSVEALASAAAFVQPYKASILYGQLLLPISTLHGNYVHARGDLQSSSSQKFLALVPGWRQRSFELL